MSALDHVAEAGPGLPLDVLRRDHGASTPWRRLRAFLALERADIWIVVVYAVAIGLLNLATPVAVQALVNTVAFASLLQPIVVLTVLLALGLGGYAALRIAQIWAVETVLRRVFVRALVDVGRRLARLDPGARGARPTELMHRVFEAPLIQKSLAVLLLDGTALVLQTLVGFALLAAYHPLLLAFSLALLLLLSFVVFVIGRGAMTSALAESAAKYEAVEWLERVSALPTAFRSGRGRDLALARIDTLAARWLAARRHHFRRLGAQHVGGAAIAVLGNTALLGLGGVLVLRQQLTLGQLVAAELVVAALSAAFLSLGNKLESLYDLTASVTKLAHVTDAALERDAGAAPVVCGPAAIDLVEVDFAHVDRPPLLRGVSLALAPREHLVVVGAAATGKSTLLDLVHGTRAPLRGRILIDGLPLAQLDLAALRDDVALVRGVELVSDTILGNLRLTGGQPDLGAVEGALRTVGLDRLVVDAPAGLDTRIDPDGAPLSRSEARRLVLARALLGRPRLLLLDGALDGLGLGDAALARLLDVVFADDAPWTAMVVSADPRVLTRARRQLALGGDSA